MKFFGKTKEATEDLAALTRKVATDIASPDAAIAKSAVTKHYDQLVAEQKKRVPLATQAPELKYNQVSWLAPHNSYASTYPLSGKLENQFNYYYAQQLFSLEQLLNIGCRVLDLDTHENTEGLFEKEGYKKGEVYHAHQNLILDRLLRGKLTPPRTFTSSLEMIKRFLEENPQEIVTLTFENYVEANKFDQTVLSVPGLEKFILKPEDWNPQKQNGWPTLGWMVKNNKRLVLFMETGEETKVARKISDQFVATGYGTLDVKKLVGTLLLGPSKEQPKFLFAAVLTTSEPVPTIPSGTFLQQAQYIINHLNEIQKNTDFQEINSSLLEQFIEDLKKKYGRLPNFIALDHVEVGNGFKIVDRINEQSIKDKEFRDTWLGQFQVVEK
jgi:hypothetical protein